MKKLALSCLFLLVVSGAFAQSTLTLGRSLTGTSYNTTAPVT